MQLCVKETEIGTYLPALYISSITRHVACLSSLFLGDVGDILQVQLSVMSLQEISCSSSYYKARNAAHSVKIVWASIGRLCQGKVAWPMTMYLATPGQCISSKSTRPSLSRIALPACTALPPCCHGCEVSGEMLCQLKNISGLGNCSL